MNTELRKHVDDFDNGDEVKTVIMGGISNGYEIAIQELAMEIMRILSLVKIPDDNDAFRSLLSVAEQSAIKKVSDYGYSGAQVGAAKNLAAIYYKQTPSKALKILKDKDRLITISKDANGLIKLSRDIES
jgi:hypothetical protein